MTTTTANATATPIQGEQQAQAATLETGDHVYDLAHQKTGWVVAMNPDTVSLRADDEVWETEWSSIAVMRFGIPDHPGIMDPDLVCERGGDPFYGLGCEVALVRDRVTTRLEELRDKMACPKCRAQIDERAREIDGDIAQAECELSELSHMHRVALAAWAAGRGER